MFNEFEELSIPVLENGLRLPELELTKSDFEKFDIKSGDNFEYLQNLVAHGLTKLIRSNKISESDFDAYSLRCKEELETFQRLSLVDYILLVYDVISWAKSNSIPVGPGRGSSAGSCVLYCIGVTSIDPIKFGLYFSRFISEARAKTSIIDKVTYLVGAVPDIDTDFSFKRREEVIKYIESRYTGRTAKIATYGTLSSKICIKECVKALLNYTEEEASRISAFVDKKFGTVIDLIDSYNENPEFKKWTELSPQNKEAFRIALTLEDIPKSKGQHASGVAISFGSIFNVSPVERTPDGLDLMTTFDMKDVAYLLVKMDVLGLKNLDVIDDTLRLVNKTVDDIDLNDPAIYDFLKDNEHYYSFFQIEKGLGKDTVKKISPNSINQMAACISVGRPGAMKFIDDLVKFYHHGEAVDIYPKINEILKETGNIIIYQEQINAICQEVYEMTPTEADVIRYNVGKKLKEEMAKNEPDIRNRGDRLVIPINVTDWFWSTCNASADYLFNKSHGLAYAHITLMDVWLKTYYPKEFYLACLNMARNEQDSSHETAIIQKEMRLMNIDLLPPSLKISKFDFTIEETGIRYGLSSIKGISDAGMKKLLNFNRANSNKIELFNSCLDAKLGLNVVRSLINAGCFDDFKTNRPKLLLEFQLFNELTPKEKKLGTQFSQTLGDDTFSLVKYLCANKNEKGKEYIKESRLNTLRRDTEKFKDIYLVNSKKSDFYNWFWERELLGYSYSYNLIELFNATEQELVTLDSAVGGISGEFFTVAVCVKDMKKMKAKQTGNEYYKIFVDDDFSNATILSFAKTEVFSDIDVYDQWYNNLILICRVKKTDREYLIAEWIKPLWNETIK
jgi:DNA polymerase III subunit alpha